jgi:hypothetical protein
VGARVLSAVPEPQGGVLLGYLGCCQLEGRGEEVEVDLEGDHLGRREACIVIHCV